MLAPGSVLTKKPPRWIVVADLVETSRLFGRIAARVEPEAIERVAGHLVQRNYSEPHWEARRGEVVALRAGDAVWVTARSASQSWLRQDRAGTEP